MDRLRQPLYRREGVDACIPGQTVTVTDPAAYGCILVQGHGAVGVHAAETATMLRFGQLSADEFFVSEQRRAHAG